MNRYTVRHKKNASVKIFLLIAAILAVMLLATIIIGNILKTRVASAQQGRQDLPKVSPTDSVFSPVTPQKSSASVRAGYISPALFALSPEEATEHLKTLEADAVSLVAGKDGFSWSSQIKESLNIPPSESPAALENAIPHFQSNAMYVSLIFESEFGNYSDSERKLHLALESALACELAELRPNELLFSFDGNVDDEDLDEFYTCVKSEHPEIPVGILLPCTVLDSEHYYADIHKYYDVFDFIVMDFSCVRDASKYVEKASVYYSLYNVRPAFEGEFIPSDVMLEALDAISVDFWQTLAGADAQMLPTPVTEEEPS